jgi:general secretion pathway protein F
MRYQLRVLKHGLAPYHTVLNAASLDEARHQAEQQGLTVLQVKPQTTPMRFLAQGPAAFPLVLFCQEFRVLFEAGLSVSEVLETLIAKETNTATAQVLQALLTAVSEGKTLSQAFSLQAEVFPSLFTATVSAAETTGDLPEALLRYSQYLESVDLLKKRIISASVYPAIVVGFGLLVLLFLIIYVIPKFSKIYETQVHSVSTSTQLLLKIGTFSQQYGVYIMLLFALAVIVILSMLTQPHIRAKLYGQLWRIPYLGEKMRIYHLSRFYRTFSMLLKSGIPVLNGLSMVDSLMGAGLTSNLQQAKKHIAEGQSFSQALNEAQLTTPVALRLFNVGEKTGTLDQMMERTASFHEDQMLRWVDRFTKIFEPALMALIGVLIGGIVLMMYMPIFELASGIE